MREIVIDTETTGLDFKKGDRIIEVACIELINHVPSGKYLQFYCSTEKKINQEAFQIHGLSNNFLNKFLKFDKQAKKLLDFINNDTLIIHNAEFDLGFINNELSLSGLKTLKNKTVDTVPLARKTLNTRIVNLDSLCKRFSIDLSRRKFHGALLDCQLLSEVYIELLGGRQTKLELTKIHENMKEKNEKHKKSNNNILKIKTSERDIEEHKNFIADLNNALWHKVDY